MCSLCGPGRLGGSGGQTAYLSDIERRLTPYFERAKPRQRAMAYLPGLLSPAERKNRWPLADVSGDTTPYGFHHLLRRAQWTPEAVRGEFRPYVLQHLVNPEAVLVLDETGMLKSGQRSAGVARQDRGTAGKVQNGQFGVCLGYARALGHALLDRELYMLEEWTDDYGRYQQAGMPAAPGFATKPQLVQQRLQRVFAAGVPPKWVTGDSVYGSEWRVDMTRCGTTARLAAWSSAALGDDESAGK
jgi:SRSO17 transposase